MAGNQGLSQNSSMSDEDRERIPRMGGAASNSGGTSQTNNSDVTRNRSGGGALKKSDKAKGGKHSHGTQYS